MATGLEEVLGDTEVAGTRETRDMSFTVQWVLAAGMSKSTRTGAAVCLDRGRWSLMSHSGSLIKMRMRW